MTAKKKGNLMKSLTVVVGMMVVMTANVDVEDCLINGASGVVKYRMEGTNRLVLSEFCLMILELVGHHERNTERYIIQVSKENGRLYLIYNEHLY